MGARSRTEEDLELLQNWWGKSQNQGSSGAKEIQGIKIFRALKKGEASLETKFVIFFTTVIPKNKLPKT